MVFFLIMWRSENVRNMQEMRKIKIAEIPLTNNVNNRHTLNKRVKLLLSVVIIIILNTNAQFK